MSNEHGETESNSNIIEQFKKVPEIKVYLAKEESKEKSLVRVILENATTYGLIGILIGAIVTGYAQWQSNIAERDTQIIIESLKESNDYNGLIDSLNKLSLLRKAGLISAKIDSDKFKQLLPDTIATNLVEATQYEVLGFQALLDQNLGQAKDYFNKSYKAYPTYHNVDEISNKLLKKKTSVSDWGKEIYCPIVEQYSWKMPEDQKKQMTTKGNCSPK